MPRRAINEITGNPMRLLWLVITAPFRLVFSFFSSLASDIRALFDEEPPEDDSLPDAFAKTVENPAGALEHLNALRRHLLRGVVVLVITTGLAFAFTNQIINLLAQPVGGLEALQIIEVTESLGTFMRVALLFGFAVALPYIAFELWLFAAPGLYRKSRFQGIAAIPLVAVFFIGGMAFAYFIMLPTALPFLLNFMGVEAAPRLSSYVGFVTGLMFWIGLAFEFPLVIFVLALLGLVQGQMLVAQWRLAVVIIAVVSAMITPTVDPVSMSLVMGPLFILYLLSIGLAFMARRNR
jgi:sec-independent protein translocase protein TatC